ncbi:CAX interacting protein 4 [Tasmannia lanceolata]|uniref:CAX interacting protein 4 n=1 Tax=Tasmannia lanceolata TaxID=3420 RepID=UPI0040647854
MPATAGRVRMPANNRVHSSAALQTHGIWQSAIGYDPYAPNKDDSKHSAQEPGVKSSNSEPDAENAYASFQGLLALARITGTGSNADEARGACKKCGRVGHLTFQCRNFLSTKVSSDKDKDPSLALQTVAGSLLDKSKANGRDSKGAEESSEESSEEESESSDSDVDSEIEKIIATRVGKKGVNHKVKLSSKRRAPDEDGSDSGGQRKRGRSRKWKSGKRASGDSDEEDDGDVKRRKEKRKSRHGYSDDEDDERHRHRKSRKEKKRRRSHRHSDYSDESEESDGQRKQKNRRPALSTDSGSSSLDDSRIGRGTKRSHKKRSRKHQRQEERH